MSLPEPASPPPLSPFAAEQETAERLIAGRVRIEAELAKVIVGQRDVIEQILLALLAGGVSASNLAISEDPAFGNRPFLAAKRDGPLTVVSSAHEVSPDVVHVILVLHEKERRHLSHETRIYMVVGPPDFAKFIVV